MPTDGTCLGQQTTVVGNGMAVVCTVHCEWAVLTLCELELAAETSAPRSYI